MAETAIGVSIDAVPYLTGGDSLQIWVGRNNMKLRVIRAFVYVPNQYTNDGFINHRIRAKALLLDYVFGEDYSGYWIGIGYEQWDNTIEDKEQTESASFSNEVFTTGGGYIWKPVDTHIYVNPWIGIHYIYNNEDSVDVGDREYEQDTYQVSASVKLGWQF